MKGFRTVASMVLCYNGNLYDFDYDFGDDYPEDAARYMFDLGNYSCDCNLSLFLRQRYGDHIPECDCGEDISIINFKIDFIKI